MTPILGPSRLNTVRGFLVTVQAQCAFTAAMLPWGDDEIDRVEELSAAAGRIMSRLAEREPTATTRQQELPHVCAG